MPGRRGERTRRVRTLTGLLALAACGPGEPPAREEATVALAEPAWEVQHTDSASTFIAISIVDPRTVWVVGQPGAVLRTTDGGTTWTALPVPGGETLSFRDVEAFSDREAFILSIGSGDASRIYRTSDGGRTWVPSFLNDDPEAFFDCMSFWDRERAFAFSDSHDGEFTLIRTLDGGATWSRVDPAAVPDARPGDGAFAASGTCTAARPGGRGWFVTGASGVDTRVIRTSDYGETWTEAPTPVPSTTNTEGLASVAFFDARNGAVFGTAPDTSDAVNVATTSDGGATWVPAARVLGGVAYGGAVVPGTPTPTLVAVSPAGSVYSTDGGVTWSVIDDVNYWTAAFLDADVGWAAGRGRISRVVNGGR